MADIDHPDRPNPPSQPPAAAGRPGAPAAGTPRRPNGPAGLPPEPPPRRRRRWLLPLLVVILLVVLAVVLWRRHEQQSATGAAGATGASGSAAGGRRGGRGRGAAAGADQPQAVRVAKVVSGEIPIVRNALGTVTPLATVTVRTQIAGQLMQVAFTEGQIVKKGDLLAVVDPRPYEISLRQAQGTLARDQALLKQAQNDLARFQTLLKQDSIAGQTVDDQVSLVEQDKGIVRSDEAQIDTFKLDLAYCHITAPVSGRVGLRQVDAGNYVQTGDTNGIVVITQLQPISALFTLPEDDIPVVTKRVATGAQLSASAYDRSNTTQLAVGALQTVDNVVDTTTGTFKLRAGFANADNALFPSQFVNVRLLVDTLRNATIVPSASVLTGSIGTYVYVVKPDNTVTVRKITTGPVDGERTSVSAGLQPGETVVIDGTDRLREGAKILIPAAHAAGASGAAAGASGATAGADAASGAATPHAHRRHRAAASS